MVKTLSLVLLIALSCGFIAAQEIIYEQYESGVDFWVLIPYNSLNFAKEKTTTDYQFSVVIKNARKKQVADFAQNLIVPKKDWLNETAIPLRFTKVLSPGAYTAEFKLKNKTVGDKRTFKKSFVINAKNTEVGQSWLIAKREGIYFIPNQIEDIAKDLDELVLNLSYSAKLDSIMIQADTRKMHITNLQNPIQADLKPFLTAASGEQPKITLYEANIRYAVEPFLFSEWYSYSVRYTLEEQLEQLRYVASQNEWQVLRSVPEEKYNEAIASYWKANDPSPGTERNENRERFYQRVLMADQLFTVHKMLKGWRSDRGRIYIKKGEPDEIVADPYPSGRYPLIIWNSDRDKIEDKKGYPDENVYADYLLGRYPNIIWTYYQQNLEYIFIDTQGYGLYILLNKEEEYE
ncbi:MAG: GWxTD domain-containing protein [Candidatus Cloacimonetes bacterium]|nr:GWxTD domain-containing protein [Candidatus Cloacimonadota bacterium]